MCISFTLQNQIHLYLPRRSVFFLNARALFTEVAVEGKSAYAHILHIRVSALERRESPRRLAMIVGEWLGKRASERSISTANVS